MSKKFNHAILRVKNSEGTFDPLSALRGQNSYELAVKAGFTGSEEEWMESLIGDGWIGAYQDVEARVGVLENSKLVLTNTVIETESFVSDSTYPDYPFRASVPIETVTASMIPEVIFSVEDATSGSFSPVSETYDGGVYIYVTSIPNEMISIPTIIIWR